MHYLWVKNLKGTSTNQFADEQGRKNLNIQQAQGIILLVPQFTLVANTQNVLRPSFDAACEPSQAKVLFEACAKRFKAQAPTQTGVFVWGSHAREPRE